LGKKNNNIEIVFVLSCDEMKSSFEFSLMRFDC